MIDNKSKKTDNHFPQNLRLLMALHGNTYRQLEAATGINRSSLSEYARGVTGIPLRAAETIAEYYGVTVDRMTREPLSDKIGGVK